MRRSNALKNFFSSFFPYLLLILLGFWKINVWQHHLNESVYALNQLFFQIVAYLTLAETSFGLLLAKEYYRLLAQRSTQEICAYYTLSKKIFRQISLAVWVIGVGLSFFLPLLARNNALQAKQMQLLFLLFLARSLVDYWFFSPRFVLQADQKLYKMNGWIQFFRIMEVLTEIALIQAGWSYASVLIVTLGLRVMMNVTVNHLIFREYPWLCQYPGLKKEALTGLPAVLRYQVVCALNDHVAVIFISALLDPLAVTIYSNYQYVTKYLSDGLSLLVSALIPGLGNLLYMGSCQEREHVFHKISLLFCFLACFLTCMLGQCLESLMVLWVGADKILHPLSWFSLLCLFFYTAMRQPLEMLKEIYGYYQPFINMYQAEAVLQIVLALAGLSFLGLTGLFLARLAALLLTEFWSLPRTLYQAFFPHAKNRYMRRYLSCGGLTAVCLGLSQWLLPAVPLTGYIPWLIYTMLYGLGLGVLLGAIFYGVSPTFRELLQLDIRQGVWKR